MVSNNIKIKIWLGLFLMWGILTGRCLPQWEDMAGSPCWFGDILMYWIMVVVGLIFIWQSHRAIKINNNQ